MLNRELCARCLEECWGPINHSKPLGEKISWLCPVKYDSKTGKSKNVLGETRVKIIDEPPAGCLRLFEYCILAGTEDVK